MAKTLTPTALQSRLRIRGNGAGRHGYLLDLRGAEWGDLGRLTVRRPGSPGWPHRGPGAPDHPTAELWAGHPDYCALVARRREIGAMGPAALTVLEAIDAYLEALMRDKGDRHPTYRNRSTSLRRHTQPFHSRMLGSLTREVVERWLAEVRVNRGPELVRPARATRAALLQGLLAVWRHHLPTVAPPFAAIGLGPDERRRAVREAIEAGQALEGFMTEGAYSPAELHRLLVAARWYHRQVVDSSPPLRARTREYWSEALALMAATSARLQEATRLQWQHVREDEGLLLVPGTKTRSALRAQPLQEALRPWLEQIRRAFRETYGREPGHLDYLLQSDPRQPRTSPVSRGLGERIAAIQEIAGLKRPQKAAHILRSTYISAAHAVGIPRERLKHYIGHAPEARGGWDVTDGYVHLISSLIKEEDRHVMDHLPGPQEVESGVRSFAPALTMPIAA
jgi:integrase